jgi:hypothetical protein
LGVGIASQVARQQFALSLKHRISDVGVDPFHIAQHIEVEGTCRAAFDPPGTHTREMRFRGLRFEVPKNLLLTKKKTCGAGVVRHENGGSRVYVAS